MARLLTFLIALVAAPTMTAAQAASPCHPIFDRVLPDIDEKPRHLCGYSGQVVLVVNTASQCGFTPQYEGLEALYRKLRARGFVVLGFPSNDFHQEPGSNREIASFCRSQYSIGFPMFARSTVRGPAANPLYAALARASGREPRWNFHKYLVDRSGREVLAFESSVAPNDPRMLREIERMLAARP